MLLSDPFPLDRLPKPVQHAIQTEFQGRSPTLHEIVQILDTQWLTLPGMGPTRLARLRALLAESMGKQDQLSGLTRMTVAELLIRYDRLTVQQERLQAKLGKVRGEIWTTKLELWMRGIVPHAE
ncbi:hypothetical protein [Microvirga makkahensis]|uniref:Uncharacterized protein n=1 Tax=Microvirga makkahensis TaxID=1128670 RepID=A0A7X3MVJ7_9HYPH|nr:hypothetical protein [Microvirga makkahensis]MXQ14036.1 hypothetical protein [Microvirga makkahensis]